MRIASLGWGSLIWDHRDLPVSGKWQTDGPTLPIEFARESSRKRLTLVIADVSETVASLWVLLEVDSLDAAKEALALREGIKEGNIQYSVGWWRKADGASNGRGAAAIAAWAPAHKLDAVVWTNLKPGLKGRSNVVPDYDAVLGHFQMLIERGEHADAEEYVRKTPIQIMTGYRQRLQEDLGWTAIQT
ncbi:MAG: hypothetical protein E5V60_01145 [Mesorhizobium sp.]|nr:MAG: hypothetical protein E5V60_01145 [Mesorhizobium sp.]